MSDLILRECPGCGQTDDHPRHVVATGGGVDVNWHMDCHVIATKCEVCASQISEADGAKGDELRVHLTTKDG